MPTVQDIGKRTMQFITEDYSPTRPDRVMSESSFVPYGHRPWRGHWTSEANRPPHGSQRITMSLNSIQRGPGFKPHQCLLAVRERDPGLKLLNWLLTTICNTFVRSTGAVFWE